MSASRIVCVVGDPTDLCATYLSWHAERRGFEVVALAEADFGLGWHARFDDPPLDPPAGELIPGIEFRRIAGTIVRFSPYPHIPESLGLGTLEQLSFLAERRAAIRALVNRLPGVVVNRTTGGRSNGAKPLQMRMLERAGFSVPEWTATNDPRAARSFMASHGTCVYKSCSGMRSHVRLADDALIERLEEGTTPVIIQRRIEGHDVRVHTVAQRVFPTEIRGASVDYRFEHENNEYGATEIAPELARMCVDVTREDGLVLSGIDFRVAEDGKWYCLEMNPVPTFLPYEVEAEQPIAGAVLDLFGAPR